MDNQAFEDNETPDLSRRAEVSRRRRRGLSAIFSWREVASDLLESHQTVVTWGTFLTLGLAYHAYFAYCLYRHIKYDIPIFSCSLQDAECEDTESKVPPRPYWCDSFGFLIIITILGWTGVLYGYMIKPVLKSKTVVSAFKSVSSTFNKFLELKFAGPLMYLAALAAIATFIIVDTRKDPRRLVGAGGALVLILIGWIFSVHPDQVRWRPIIWGHCIQFVFALIALRWELGNQVVQCLSSKVGTFLDYTYQGAGFVFAYLATGKPFQPELFNITDDAQLTDTVQTILGEINDQGVLPLPSSLVPSPSSTSLVSS